jgi:hypothetical protein
VLTAVPNHQIFACIRPISWLHFSLIRGRAGSAQHIEVGVCKTD